MSATPIMEDAMPMLLVQTLLVLIYANVSLDMMEMGRNAPVSSCVILLSFLFIFVLDDSFLLCIIFSLQIGMNVIQLFMDVM